MHEMYVYSLIEKGDTIVIAWPTQNKMTQENVSSG